MLYDVTLPEPVPTAIDQEAPAPAHFYGSENSGLFSSLYLASQAFRYAVTRDQDALTNVRRLLKGLERYMQITGVAGLFAREIRDSRVPGFECPTKPSDYVWPSKRDRNSWVMVGEDGCGRIYDPVAGTWIDAGACPGVDFAGQCWKRNTSRDEYAGDMFAIAVVAKLVEDPAVQATTKSLAAAVGEHLVAHNYWITDVDGLPTRHGASYALALSHFPGFLALQALSWTETAMRVGDSKALERFYDECLLQKDGARACIDQPLERDSPTSYKQHLQALPIALGKCVTNYDNVGMVMLAYFAAMFLEPNAKARATLRDNVERGLDNGAGHDLRTEGSPFINFIVAATSETSGDPAIAAMVGDGVCALYDVPSPNTQRAVDAASTAEVCVSERHGSLAQDPLPLDQRCATFFEWWRNPRARRGCSEDPRVALQPTGFLLPYWMGRYFGFVSAQD